MCFCYITVQVNAGALHLVVSFFCEFEVLYKPTFSVSKKVLFCFLNVNIMPFFTCGSVHQGDERFSNDSRGKQCSFISLTLIALFVEQTIPVCEWNCQTVDNILSLLEIACTFMLLKINLSQAQNFCQ